MYFVLSLFIVAGSMLIGGTLGEVKGYLAAKSGVEMPASYVDVDEIETLLINE